MYITGNKTICSFVKLNCYNLYRLYVSPRAGGTNVTYFFLIHFFILITVPLYRRKFCDGLIILVFPWNAKSDEVIVYMGAKITDRIIKCEPRKILGLC